MRHINATELANGFFSRFMLIAVQRSKELPFGGRLTGNDLAVVRRRFETRSPSPRAPRAVALGPEARERWVDAYSACPEAMQACSAHRLPGRRRTLSVG